MNIVLRIHVPDTAEGDNFRQELVTTWLHTSGEVTIVTPNVDLPVRLTYVKEN